MSASRDSGDVQKASTEDMVKDVVKKLLIYSFRPIDWQLENCTEKEKLILGNQATLHEVARWAHS